MIPYGRQSIDEADIAAVVAVLRSDWLTQGPAIERFEQAVAGYCRVEHAVAVCNATAALHLACRALGLGPGDWLWTSPNTFVASANCALYCGAQVDFVDIDATTYNMSVDALAAKLDQADRAGRLPKIVVPVHFAGQSCDMAGIGRLAERYGFRIIEDASHAIGGRYHDQPVGDCRYADIAVFSFHPVKIITTGEGGVATTRNPQLAEKLRLLRSHGISRDPTAMHSPPPGAWYYEQIDLGYNYRMTDLQAALGLSQLSRLDDFVAARVRLAARYSEGLSKLPLVLPRQQAYTASSWHLYVALVDPARGEANRDGLFRHLRDSGIGVNVHYIPVYRQPYYHALGYEEGDFPNAENYYRCTITLPLFPGLAPAQQDYIVETLSGYFAGRHRR